MKNPVDVEKPSSYKGCQMLTNPNCDCKYCKADEELKMITRYEETASGAIEDDEGAYCAYSDYQKLEEENARLKAERDTAIKEMTSQSRQHGYAQAKIDRLRQALEEIAEYKDTAARLIAKAALEKSNET